jgi:hypothetical protein
MRSHKEKRVLKDSEDSHITVSFCGDTFILKNVFIGGRNTKDDSPMGVYSGVLDIAEMGISLLTMFRAILRTTREEMGMPTDTTEDFILFCLAEAMKRENEESKQQAIEEFVNKYFSDHF